MKFVTTMTDHMFYAASEALKENPLESRHSRTHTGKLHLQVSAPENLRVD